MNRRGQSWHPGMVALPTRESPQSRIGHPVASGVRLAHGLADHVAGAAQRPDETRCPGQHVLDAGALGEAAGAPRDDALAALGVSADEGEELLVDHLVCREELGRRFALVEVVVHLLGLRPIGGA